VNIIFASGLSIVTSSTSIRSGMPKCSFATFKASETFFVGLFAERVEKGIALGSKWCNIAHKARPSRKLVERLVMVTLSYSVVQS